MKKLSFILISLFVCFQFVYGQLDVFRTDFQALENYSGILEMGDGYEIKEAPNGNLEIHYESVKIYEYSLGQDEKNLKLRSSFTIVTNKGNFLFNDEDIFLNGEFYSSIKDSDILYYDANYLVIPSGVYQLYSKLSKDAKSGSRKNKIDTLRMNVADPQTFKVWSTRTRLSSDKNHVYSRREIVDGLHGDGFELLEEGFYRNEGNIYRGSLTSSKLSKRSPLNLHAESFKSLGEGYAEDKYGIYYFDSGGKHDVNADASTFELFDSVAIIPGGNGMLARDKNSIFFGKDIISKDVDGFQHHSKHTGKDSDYFYCNGIKIDGVDLESLEPIFSLSEGEIEIIQYFKDKNNVYQTREDCEIIPGLDGETFEYLNLAFYKDKDYVYYKGKEIDADQDSFELIEIHPNYQLYKTEFGKDDTYLYLGKVKSNYFDAPSLEVLSIQYFKDKNGAYFGKIYRDSRANKLAVEVELIENVDLDTFQISELSRKYAIDKDNVYLDGVVVEGMNPSDL